MIHELEGQLEGPDSFSLSKLDAEIAAVGTSQLPGLIVRAGKQAIQRFVEVFVATVRNHNTRYAYAQAVGQFCRWCDARKIELVKIRPVVVAAHIEELTTSRSAPSVKQHLAAIRMLFDFLVTGIVLEANPAWSVRGPKQFVRKRRHRC